MEADWTAADWSNRVRRLEAEVAGLRRGLRNRGLIEQAKGVLAERLGIDVEEAFRHLTRTSQDTNVRVVDVAADLMAAQRPGDEPLDPSSARARAAAAALDDAADLATLIHDQLADLPVRAVAVHLAAPRVATGFWVPMVGRRNWSRTGGSCRQPSALRRRRRCVDARRSGCPTTDSAD